MSRCSFDKDGNGIPLRKMLSDQREACKYDKCANLLDGHVFSLTLNMRQGGQRAFRTWIKSRSKDYAHFSYLTLTELS